MHSSVPGQNIPTPVSRDDGLRPPASPVPRPATGGDGTEPGGGASTEGASGRPTRTSRAVAYWLLACCGLVAVMVILGGLTRLTHSGLSMVEWRPHDLLPPTSEAEWQAAFDAYKRFPEYQRINPDMDLAGFKEIFWLEYVHRLWGRLLGLALVLPLAWFLWRRAVARPLVPALLGIVGLSGLQGVLGWVMVRSGLVGRPDVSHYRLAAHLLVAVLIYGAMLWIALGILRLDPTPGPDGPRRRLRRWLAGVSALALVTVVWGALVAGLDAGFVHNTFPLMGDRPWPDRLGSGTSIADAVEDPSVVQFVHRVLGVATLAGALVTAAASRGAALPSRARAAVLLVPAVAAAQFALGVSTLVLTVPVPVAAAHQAGALALLTTMVWALGELRAPRAAAGRTPVRAELSPSGA